MPFVLGAGAGASTAAAAAACLSTFSLFFSSFVCSPGQSAGTFIWHLLWQVNPQSVQMKPFADKPQMRSPQRSQFVGILNVSDLNVCDLPYMLRSPTTAVMVDVSTSAVS